MKKQPTTIEICGIGFPNKGAELMLIAIKQYMQQHAIRWCMTPKNDYHYRAQYQLWQKSYIDRFGFNFAQPLAMLPWKFRRFFGLLNESQVDIVFDASGFAYGDQWGLKNTQRLAKNVEKWHKQGKKIVLFPQAFGPFELTGHGQLVKDICSKVDLIFARDPDSYSYLINKTDKGNVFLSPDFTPLVTTEVYKTSLAYRDYVCVIPNNKMLTKGDKTEQSHYLEFIVNQVDTALSITDKVVLLSHDGHRDSALIESIQAKISQPVQCLYIESATELKSVIASAKVVISSRFHGLVSALSNGIPIIATGWSHKYRHLLSDYNAQAQLYKSQDKDTAAEHLTKLLNDEQFYYDTAKVLSDKGQDHKQKVEQMWAKIEDLIQLEDSTL
ncbi:polysaccharide pyruvyl transferase family protein [Shewanella sp. UCD-KL12]|uniref:polysaccharide pyruvyl transferase family protein n=1 Tax=Shewanella sp. UCD-KL12 TaxID=1917163 RepID=UPI000970E3DA|nr:polysaccharide pyruvyl transferase family protein [Shewanella sp. UCD-KL12]